MMINRTQFKVNIKVIIKLTGKKMKKVKYIQEILLIMLIYQLIKHINKNNKYHNTSQIKNRSRARLQVIMEDKLINLFNNNLSYIKIK